MRPLYKSERKKPKFLKPRKKKRPVRTHSTIRCPVNGLQVSWCRMLCTPIDDLGLCGRPAPHNMKSRTQEAIARQLGASGESRE